MIEPDLRAFGNANTLVDGFGLLTVMGLRRSPFPPARTIAGVFIVMFPAVDLRSPLFVPAAIC